MGSDRPEDLERAVPHVAELLHDEGGLRPGASERVGRLSGVPAADVFGVGTFFHLLAEPDVRVRVCTGLSCRMAGGQAVLAEAVRIHGADAVRGCSCLAACDAAPAALVDRTVVPQFDGRVVPRFDGQGDGEGSGDRPGGAWVGAVSDGPVFGLAGSPAGPDRPPMGEAFRRAREAGAEAVIAEVVASGLQGRGGAGFPAGVKWRAVAGQPAAAGRCVVLNADEGEPGTFKDREVLLRRPELVLEGLAIAAFAVGAREVWCYLRGEFDRPWNLLRRAIDEAGRTEAFPGISFHMHAGHGAYICGEETALLEALEGRRGMPRLKPPYPTERGLFGRPTLIHNVETIACVPAVATRGGAWFAGLGRTGPGTKLYCVSGDVARPGVYELPLGVSVDELVGAAGGYVGALRAFSPGGASSGFLPASERHRPLDFRSLREVGTLLGSAGVVVLNDTRDLRAAAAAQLEFFEAESCGQCAPCRIGTQFLRRALERGDTSLVDEVAWEMNEGSICGLGQAAALPFTSLLRWFPEEVGRP